MAEKQRNLPSAFFAIVLTVVFFFVLAMMPVVTDRRPGSSGLRYSAAEWLWIHFSGVENGRS